MAQEGNQEALLGALCASVEAYVTYRPLRTEVPLTDVFPIPAGSQVYEILPRASLDPYEEVLGAVEALKGLSVAVLLPGRAFDNIGTRLGQGGGWYDRFLSKAPVEWIRIGFCFDNQLSDAPLPRQPWDEPVDIVCVLEQTTNTLTCMETRARMPAFLEN